MKTVIVIPAYNEERVIHDTVLLVVDAMRRIDEENIDLVLVNNGSTDATGAIIKRLSGEYPHVITRSELQQGKGHAVLNTWEELKDRYDFFIFMDADLATSLDHLEELMRMVKSGADVVIGSRHLRESKVSREYTRKIASHIYHVAAKTLLGSSVSDFPCGFKAVSRRVVCEIVPLIEERTWFFDTELLYRVEQAGYEICEIPVVWQELRTKENASRLNLPSVSLQYIRGLRRLRKLKKRL